MMPVEQLPAASWQTALGLGFVSAVFDNIPLTALALKQGGYDWGFLAYAVGFGGSMIWFGSSAGVALSNMFPEAKIGRSVAAPRLARGGGVRRRLLRDAGHLRIPSRFGAARQCRCTPAAAPGRRAGECAARGRWWRLRQWRHARLDSFAALLALNLGAAAVAGAAPRPTPLSDRSNAWSASCATRSAARPRPRAPTWARCSRCCSRTAATSHARRTNSSYSFRSQLALTQPAHGGRAAPPE